MKVLNVHNRLLDLPKEKVAELFRTLATKNDMIWPFEHWPRMKFKDGLKVGAKGGHGPIRYSIEKFEEGKLIQFRFSKPHGFNGIHRLEINEVQKDKTEIKHVIDMETSLQASFLWSMGVRWLHDALIEDALDKVENHFFNQKKTTKWNLWVKLLRKVLK